MHILIGSVLALFLLHHWLIGHWFARVVMAIVLAAFGVLVGGVVNIGGGSGGVVMLVGLALAWPVSGLPTCVHRERRKDFERRQASLRLNLR